MHVLYTCAILHGINEAEPTHHLAFAQMLGLVAGRMHPEVMVRHVRPRPLLLCDNKMAVVLERDGEITVSWKTRVSLYREMRIR